MAAPSDSNASQTADVRRGTLIGSTAIVMWSTLALLTALSGGLPPLQLLAMSFTLASLIGVGLWWWQARQQGQPLAAATAGHFRLPGAVWAVGLYGLFGYHLAYFLALRHAPPADASLINYLWPLLIVLFSALLPGERLRWYHVAGAAVGFAGIVVLITRGAGLTFERQYVLGYVLALACAVIWASYSVMSRYLGRIPTSSVGAFCAATAVLALAGHLLLEVTVWPTGLEWLAVIGLGLGPVGAAFYTWDYGVKRGNIQTLGTLAYAAPPLSTLLLIVAGRAEPTWYLLAASFLIAGGALLASGRWQRHAWRRGRPNLS